MRLFLFGFFQSIILVRISGGFRTGAAGLKRPMIFSCWDRNNLGCSPRMANVYEDCLIIDDSTQLN